MAIRHVISRTQFEGVILDLDGVITQSAKIHAKAWKEMFDAFLAALSKKTGKQYAPFDIRKDYALYVDGKPRYEGVQSFLHAREVQLPYGSQEDSPEKESICGLGNRKNVLFLKYLQDEGIEVYETSVSLVRSLRKSGFKVALISSSKNCSEILKSAGIEGLFDIQIDGIKSEELHLQGKPAPDIFLKAADDLHIKPEKAVIIEDALSGVKAASAGHFGMIIGVDRIGQSEQLKNQGADIVVTDLSEIGVESK